VQEAYSWITKLTSELNPDWDNLKYLCPLNMPFLSGE
jgi:hypothetical protein